MTEKDALLSHLAAKYVAPGPDFDIIGDDCTLTGFTGSGRCIEPSVALRWEDGFVDVVCVDHAERAKQRGALVVYPPEQTR